MCRLEQAAHQVVVSTHTHTVRRIVLPCGEACERHADEVHQVVAGEGHGEGESTHQHDYLQDIDLAPVQYLHDDAAADEEAEHQHAGVLLNPGIGIGCHEGGVLQTLDQQEVHDGGHGYAAENSGQVFHPGLIVECKYRTDYPLYHHTEDEGNRDREEDTENHREGLVCIDHLGECQGAVSLDVLNHGEGHRTAEQLEDEGNCGRCGQAPGVECVEEYHVGHHYSQHDGNQLGKAEILRLEDAVAGDVHHTVGQGRPEEDSDGGDDD